MCVAMHNVTNNKDDKACGWVVVAELSPSFVCLYSTLYNLTGTLHCQIYGLSKVCAQASTLIFVKVLK